MTPYETQMILDSHNAQIRRDQERREMLAWMIGAYTGIAVNNGKKYPQKPCLFKSDKSDAAQEMTPDQMKANLLNALGIKPQKDVKQNADNA